MKRGRDHAQKEALCDCSNRLNRLYCHDVSLASKSGPWSIPSGAETGSVSPAQSSSITPTNPQARPAAETSHSANSSRRMWDA